MSDIRIRSVSKSYPNEQLKRCSLTASYQAADPSRMILDCRDLFELRIHAGT